MMLQNRATGSVRAIVVIALAIAIGAGVWLVVRRAAPAKPQAAAPVETPATQPATQPTTAPVAQKAEPPRSYMDVVLASHPSFPTTQPLGIPLDLREGAHLVLEDPIYLDPLGQLWITRPDADPVGAVLKRASKEQTHVVRERVVFVHRSPDDKGMWHPQLVCLKNDGSYELVSAAGRQDMGKSYDYDWPRAFSWVTQDINAIVVPTRGGLSIIRPDRRPMEVHHSFYSPGELPEKTSPTQALLDWRGLLAWMPWEKGQTGSIGAARFIEDRWFKLDEAANWPQKILHLVPLLDGGVIQLWVEDHDEYAFVSLAILDPAEVNEPKILALVEQLSHPDPDDRNEAFAELTRYGQGIWPLLERLQPDQMPEAQMRIDQLLASKIEPTLGGMKLMPGRVRIITRARGGAALLHSGGGVEVPRPDGFDYPEVIAPAMLAIIPGRSIMLVPQNLFIDLALDQVTIDIVGGEIVVTDEVHGPRWWLSNHFSDSLLRKSEREFGHVVGRDARGRWLFRKNPREPAPTLIIDPTLPDPTPRLPVWRFQVEGGDVGWTAEDWPAIRRGGAWVLVNADWRPLDPKKERMILELDEEDDDEAQPATQPATAPATQETSPPILIDADGTRYYDGLETLRVVRPDGATITWPLPPEGVGTATVWLVRGGEDRLFLFNEPGRVLRIKPTPDGPEPFQLEATFTRRIPSSDNFQRIWIDPAGRIVAAHDIDTLSIMFPTGIIPPEIARKMPASEMSEMEDE